jgi:hypothetical protein
MVALGVLRGTFQPKREAIKGDGENCVREAS